MTPAGQLRAEADQSAHRARALRRWVHENPEDPARERATRFALHHEARARLFDRCAESAEWCGRDPGRVAFQAGAWRRMLAVLTETLAENARADEALDAYLAADRAARERARLDVIAAAKRTEREAPEKMRAWLREGRA